MANFEPLSNVRHAALHWQGPPNFVHVQQQTRIPLVAQELSRALKNFALAFSFQDDQPQLVALLGLIPQQNAYVDQQGQWSADYIPAYLRSYPFALLKQSNEHYAVGIDSECDLVGTADNNRVPLFNEAGQPDTKLKSVLEFLQALAQDRAKTDVACQKLNEADLLEPWPDIQLMDKTLSLAEAGLYRISTSKLQSLEQETLKTLNESGHLMIAYAQVLSQTRIADLLKRHAVQPKSNGQSGAPTFTDVDIDNLFGADDVLKF